MASKLETCMATIIGIFNDYSGKEGDPLKLNQKELESLLEKELPGYYKSHDGKDKIAKLMKTLDFNQDGEVCFKEFAMLVVCLTMACHEFFGAQKKS